MDGNSGVLGANDGNRFSNTATSYDDSGISVGLPGVDGHSGHRSAGGLYVRVCRCAAIATHSPVNGSRRTSDSACVRGRSRVSTASRGGGSGVSSK